MPDRDAIAAELVKPLLQSHVQPAKRFGPKGEYLEGWFVIEEANRIFGWDGWSYQIIALDVVSERPREIGQNKTPGFGVTYTCRVRLGVGSVAREDVGAGHGYDVDCGLAHESAIKEAATDALKRALRTFGNPFGLALYDKTRANVEDDTKGKSGPKNGTPAGGYNAEDAKSALMSATTMDDLQTRWRLIHRNHPAIAMMPEVEAAKDVRKSQLSLPDGTPFGLPNV